MQPRCAKTQFMEQNHVAPKYSRKNNGSKPTTSKSVCYCCGDESHLTQQCCFRDSECNFCSIVGHIGKVCRKKRSEKAANWKKPVTFIHEVKAVNHAWATFSNGPDFAVCQRPDAINRRNLIKHYTHVHAFL